MAAFIPTVLDQKGDGTYQFDIYSLLLRDRIIFISSAIDDVTANTVIAELLYLDALDSAKEISLYINSPGGSISAGLAIYDTMRHIRAPVHTIGLGLAASMGCLLLASGDKRSILPHTKVMIHQPLVSGDLNGKETDISIIAREITKTRRVISEIFAKHSNKSISTIEKDIENDRYMDAVEAMDYGLCDNIIDIS